MNGIGKLALKRTSVYRNGFTVAEVLVASGIFLLMLGVLVAVFYQSTAVMMKGTSQSSLQRDAQGFARKLGNAVLFGAAASLSIAADQSGLSLLTSDDADGRFRYDPVLSQALWSNYQVFYLDSAEGVIRNRQVSVVGHPEEAVPGPIENFDEAQPIETYFSAGKPILHYVRKASFKEPISGLIKVNIELARDDTRKDGPETYTFSLTRNFRN